MNRNKKRCDAEILLLPTPPLRVSWRSGRESASVVHVVFTKIEPAEESGLAREVERLPKILGHPISIRAQFNPLEEAAEILAYRRTLYCY
jgi:hypothetical protein